MTRLSPETALRRTAGGLAAAGLLAVGSLALGTPARADGPVLTIGGPADTALHPYPESGSPRKTSLGLTVSNPDGDEEGAGHEGEVTYTVDLSGVAGIADVTVAEDTGVDCEVTGATAVCHDDGVRPGLSGIADLGLTAAEGSADGASGTIRVTGASEGATFAPFTTKVTVGGPDLVMKRIAFEEEMRPGDVQPAPVTFGNKGTTAADGVLLTLTYTRGLEIPERYANCAYDGEAGEEPQDGFAWSTASAPSRAPSSRAPPTRSRCRSRSRPPSARTTTRSSTASTRTAPRSARRSGQGRPSPGARARSSP